MSNFDKVKYNTEYNKDNYTEIKFRVKKGQKAIIEKHWKNLNYKSFNAYINELIENDMKQRGEGEPLS